MYTRDYGHHSRQTHEKAFIYFHQGLSNPEIADKLGVDRATVYRWRKKAGLPAPSVERYFTKINRERAEATLIMVKPPKPKTKVARPTSAAPQASDAPCIRVTLPEPVTDPRNVTNRDVGQRLVYLRQKADIYASTAARRLGVSSAKVLQSYEIGARSTPLRVLLAASKAYNVSLDWLITGREFEEKVHEAC
jgi:transcriptional regulator with XRE-family HTH domain